MTEDSVDQRYLKYLKSLKLDLSKFEFEEYGYDNPNLVCLDAVLSINRKYDSFVIPRLNYFKENYKEIDTLEKMRLLIDKLGVESFSKVWNYNHRQRVVILSDLVNFFITNKKNTKIEDDLASMINWAKEIDVRIENFLPIKGIGFTTAQYIRKLLRVDTVKPDRHIKKSILQGTGVEMSDREAVLFVEEAAKRMGVTATQLDYAIWEYYARGYHVSSN